MQKYITNAKKSIEKYYKLSVELTKPGPSIAVFFQDSLRAKTAFLPEQQHQAFYPHFFLIFNESSHIRTVSCMTKRAGNNTVISHNLIMPSSQPTMGRLE